MSDQPPTRPAHPANPLDDAPRLGWRDSLRLVSGRVDELTVKMDRIDERTVAMSGKLDRLVDSHESFGKTVSRIDRIIRGDDNGEKGMAMRLVLAERELGLRGIGRELLSSRVSVMEQTVSSNESKLARRIAWESKITWWIVAGVLGVVGSVVWWVLREYVAATGGTP